MKDMFFIKIDDNGISLSSNMLTWIDPSRLTLLANFKLKTQFSFLFIKMTFPEMLHLFNNTK